eukprot:SAG11_NODE_7493_length_1137_cov_1.321773_1_plen_319_part_10
MAYAGLAADDIFPTLLKLAGVPMPANREFDGIDIGRVLFASAPEAASQLGHDCIMFYKSPSSEAGPAGAAKLTSLAAVRCGDYKTYWLIDTGSSTPLPDGLKPGVLSLDAPVIFKVSTDWSESSPLASGSAEWLKAKAAAETARLAHIKTLTRNIGQMGRGSSHDYAICGDPDSMAKYPSMPNCTVSPHNWSPPICLVGGSLGQCISQTSCRPGCKFINCSDPGPFPGPPSPPPLPKGWSIHGDTNAVSSMLLGPGQPKVRGAVLFLGNFTTLAGCWAACNASAVQCREFAWRPFRVSKWGVINDCYQVVSGKAPLIPQ